MKKKYFTALLPSNHIVAFCQKVQREFELMTTIPPMIILEYHNSFISKKDYSKSIDEIQEFTSVSIVEVQSRFYLCFNPSALNKVFPLDKAPLKLYLGYRTNNRVMNLEPEPMVVRNWELGFFTVEQEDDTWPSKNFTITEHWKIKKRRPKG